MKFQHLKTGAAALFLLLAQLVFAQNLEKKSIWVAPFELEGDQRFAGNVAEYRALAIRFVLQNGSLAVVERDVNKLVQAELELQKTEAFMDGKVVEQGKGTGAEFVLSGWFRTEGGLLHLKLLDAATGAAVLLEVCDLGKNLKYGDENVAATAAKKIRKSVNQLIFKWQAKEKVPVVRILEEKKEAAKLVLVAGGTAKAFSKNSAVEFFRIETETIEDEVLERFVPVGRGKVETVENANFSQVKVLDGEKEIRKFLNEKTRLYCRLSND